MSTSQDCQLQVELEITVLGVVLDPELSRAVKTQSGNVVRQTVKQIVVDLFQPVNPGLNLPGPSRPDIVQVFVEATAPTEATTFASLKPPQSPQHYLIMLGAKDWSCIRELNKELSKRNKENLGNVSVRGMASTISKSIAPPSFEDPIAALRAELGGRLDSLQTSNGTLQRTNESLRSLNTTLVQKITSLESSVTGLKSSVAGLISANDELKTSVARLKSSNEELKAKMATSDSEWNDWCKKTEKKSEAAIETLTTTCNTLRGNNTRLTKDLKTQVTWQAGVEEDLSLLDAVVLRNLVDQAQASLAGIACLGINSDIRPSLIWRTQFPHDMSPQNRILKAKSLFTDRDDARAKAAVRVLDSEGGALLVEQDSNIRTNGDSAAHGHLSRPGVSPTVMRQSEEKRAALLSVVSFLCDP